MLFVEENENTPHAYFTRTHTNNYVIRSEIGDLFCLVKIKVVENKAIFVSSENYEWKRKY